MPEITHPEASKQPPHKANKSPELVFPTSLPISARLDEIREAIQNHQVTIICGETGSGKTTQIPKICLGLGLGQKAMIGHTQPRRIAARSIANRIAEELNVILGQEVGYQIRHHDQTSKITQIKLMTDGVLLAEMQQNTQLAQYEVLIIDEAHERSLNIDLILGFLKQLLPQRPDLKVIITSATIDVERLSEHFNNAPIITVTGRSYPVSIFYKPVEEFEGNASEQNEQALLEAIEELSRENLGDILVFVHGEGEVHALSRFLVKQKLSNTEVLPLYSRLSRKAQAKIFHKHSKRHIILATNVAETSLTIPGISHVIDFGDARVSRYSHKSKIQRLPIEKISQAAAKQRTGRCGRTEEGICIRLYSEEDYLLRPEFTDPEILRTNLATVILQMKSMGLGEIEDFPFLDSPNKKLISDGIRLLNELSALDKRQQLSDVGKQMARMPLDPRLARMLIGANKYNCVAEICVLCSFLSIQDPRERPQDAIEKADKAQSKFKNPNSDFISVLNLWKFLQQQKEKLSRKQFQKACAQNYLSISRVREWFELENQLSELCDFLKFNINSICAEQNNIHCALLYGLLSHIGKKDPDSHAYIGARGNKLYIFPGSSVFDTAPEWFMAAELNETSKLYARNIAKIDPQWLLKPAKHLVKRECNEPHWNNTRQSIMAYESVSLYGLPIVVDKIVNYSKYDAKHARELFIQEALVNCKMESNAKYYMHNKIILDDIRCLEIKTRCFDKLNEEAVFDFYNERLPEKVYSMQTLDGWRKTVEKDNPQYLFIQKEQVETNVEHQLDIEYPDLVFIDNTELSVKYEYAPDNESDGITIDIPVQLLEYLVDTEFEIQFPAFAVEKIHFLLKKLPKKTRVQCQPLYEFARQVFEYCKTSKIPLLDGLNEILFTRTGDKLSVDVLNLADIPPNLKLQYRVIDSDGASIQQGNDLKRIKEIISMDRNHANCFDQANSTRSGIVKWDFDDLPTNQEHALGDLNVLVYPALVDDFESVSIQIFNTKPKADAALYSGLSRLYYLSLHNEIKYLKKNLINELALVKHSKYIYSFNELLDDMFLRVIKTLFIDNYDLVRRKQDFELILNRHKNEYVSFFQEFYKLISVIFKEYYQVLVLLEELYSPLRKVSVDDMQEQLSSLMYDGFIRHIEINRLHEYPRYLKAIILRAEKLSSALEKDKIKTLELRFYLQYLHGLDCLGVSERELRPEVVEYRWLIEEYRISLFAQEIKTKVKVSAEKLNKHIEQYKLATLKAV